MWCIANFETRRKAKLWMMTFAYCSIFYLFYDQNCQGTERSQNKESLGDKWTVEKCQNALETKMNENTSQREQRLWKEFYTKNEIEIDY